MLPRGRGRHCGDEPINSIADDFDLHPRPWYDDPRLRIGTATKAALERLFGWRIERFPREPGHARYGWETVTPPSRYPPGVAELIESMGLDQPGADDDGQWYEWPPSSPE